MFSRRLRHLVKYGLYGGVAFAGTLVAAKYQVPDYYNGMTVVRISRTAYTAVDIGRVYKKMLYSKEWDRTSDEYYAVRSEAHKIGAEKLLELCQTNKGVYIKVGQHVGALDYLLPDEYVSTMRILHKDAPRNSVEELYKVIKEDLKRSPHEIFDDFSCEPLGTASLAQVHKAKLKDGTEVAVKVQHHFVKNNINMDLKWMEIIIQIMSKVFPEFQMQWLIEETKKNINKELNFLEEGQNAEKVASMFSNYKWLKVPKIHWDYSSERVLVMDYVKGGSINDTDFIDKHKINRTEVCSKLGDLYSHMIFETGFVHSDPHPGNILLSQEPGDKEVTIYLLDHGLYAQLSDKFRYHYSKLWLAIINRDRNGMKLHSEKLGIPQQLYGLFACMVSGRPWDTIMKGIDRTKPSNSERQTFQHELPNIAHFITQCLESVDRDALLVLKTNDLIRSIEYALGTQDRQCGFLVMAHCCIYTAFHTDYKHTDSMIIKQFLTLKYVWTKFLLVCYSVYLNLFYKIKL